MAITIHKQLQVFQPVYNELIYVVSSTNTAQQNFKYVFDVYVNGAKVARELRQVNPTYGTGVIDVKRLVSPYVFKDFDITNSSGVVKNTDSFVQLQVRCGEQYGSSTGIVTYTDLTNSLTTYVFAGSLNTLDANGWNYQNYYSDKFLTNRSRIKHEIKEGQNDWLSVFTNSSGELFTISGETYDHSNALLQTFTFANPYQSLPTTDARFIKIVAGWNLNDVTTLSSGSQPLLSSNVSRFKLSVVNAAVDDSTEEINIYVQPSCAWGTEYDIHFQNSLGFDETFRFTKWTTKNTNGTRQQYLKNTGTYSATNFVTANTDETYVNYYTKIDNSWVMVSDYLGDEMIAWVKELIYSPQVRINIGGVLIPVTIETNNYTEITKQNNQLSKLEIVIKLPPDYRQLG